MGLDDPLALQDKLVQRFAMNDPPPERVCCIHIAGGVQSLRFRARLRFSLGSLFVRVSRLWRVSRVAIKDEEQTGTEADEALDPSMDV